MLAASTRSFMLAPLPGQAVDVAAAPLPRSAVVNGVVPLPCSTAVDGPSPLPCLAVVPRGEAHDEGLHLFIGVEQVNEVVVCRDPTPSAASATRWGELAMFVARMGFGVEAALPGTEAIGFGRVDAMGFRRGGDAVGRGDRVSKEGQ